MNKRHTEYIALYLFVFGAILLFGVLARKFVLVKGYDEFSAAVGFFATVVVLSALYISLQMTLNELLLPRMEKFLMRFPTFQKLEEMAVVAETPAIVAEPTEEVAVAETTSQPTEYEVLRANAIAERERESQAKLQRILDYTKQIMVAYMSEADLDRLCGYITEYSLGDTLHEVSPVSVDSALKEHRPNALRLEHRQSIRQKAHPHRHIYQECLCSRPPRHRGLNHRAQNVAHRIGVQNYS